MTALGDSASLCDAAPATDAIAPCCGAVSTPAVLAAGVPPRRSSVGPPRGRGALRWTMVAARLTPWATQQRTVNGGEWGVRLVVGGARYKRACESAEMAHSHNHHRRRTYRVNHARLAHNCEAVVDPSASPLCRHNCEHYAALRGRCVPALGSREHGVAGRVLSSVRSALGVAAPLPELNTRHTTTGTPHALP